MKNQVARTILIIFICLVVIAALGFSMGLHSFTIIEWWKPAAGCLLLSLPLTWWLARYIVRLTGHYLKYLEYPAAFVISFSVLLLAFYSINYYISDPSSRYEYDAPVVRKYSEVRKRTYKTGRRGYREEKYTVYIVELQMNDGKIKKLEKPLGEYNRIKRNGSIRLRMEDGFFRIPVIKMTTNIPN